MVQTLRLLRWGVVVLMVLRMVGKALECTLLLGGDLQEQLPKEFFINYSKEATLGQELRLVGCRQGSDYLMEGLGPEGVCFSAQCVF